jgi:hypothetical protein
VMPVSHDMHDIPFIHPDPLDGEIPGAKERDHTEGCSGISLNWLATGLYHLDVRT